MTTPSDPEPLRVGGARVVDLPSRTNSEEIDASIQQREAKDRSDFAAAFRTEWSKQQTEDRNLRRLFALLLLAAMVVQGAVVNWAFFEIGNGTALSRPS